MIIGVTGWFASGKDTVCEYLESKGFSKISLSDIIRDYCTMQGIEHTRDNLRKMGNLLREEHGADFLAQEALRKIDCADSLVDYVIPSVRQPAEVNIFRQNPDFYLWEVFAPQRVRYQRLIKRARSEDEKDLSFEQFAEKEEAEKGDGPNCQQVDKVIEMTDKKVDNSGSLELLYRNIDKILN